MKRKSIIFMMLFIVTGLFTMQGCKKADNTTFTTEHTFSVPVPTPANEGVIEPTTSTKLSWVSTGGASVVWDVYFSEDEDPVLYKKGYTSQEITVAVEEGHTYYWRLENVDANGKKTTSPIFSFTVKVTLNIDNFVGAYDVDEGGYLYSVNLTKVDDHTLANDNFWDNAPSPLWVINYVLDDLGNVEITPSGYKTSPTSATLYQVTGSGVYDNTTGYLEIDYTVKKNVYAPQLDGTVKITTTTADANTDKMTRQVPLK